MNEAAAGRVATVPRSGATALTEGRASLDAVLRSAVDRMAPATRRVVGYHLGQLDDQGAAVDLNPGKAIRSALVLLSAQVDHLSSFGLQLGLAYQLVDDLLGTGANRRSPASRPAPTCRAARRRPGRGCAGVANVGRARPG